MKSLTLPALAFAAALLAAGGALAAEACCCCKEGEKMACCDKMKAPAKPGETPKPAQPEHQH